MKLSYPLNLSPETNAPWDEAIRTGSRWAFDALIAECVPQERSLKQWGGEIEGLLMEHGRWGWLADLVKNPAHWSTLSCPLDYWEKLVQGLASAPALHARRWDRMVMDWLDPHTTPPETFPQAGLLRVHCWAVDKPSWARRAAETLPLDALNRPHDDTDRTPLMWAATFGSSPAVRVLLDRGSDPSWKDPIGRTVHHMLYEAPLRHLRHNASDIGRAATLMPAERMREHMDLIEAWLKPDEAGPDWFGVRPADCARETWAKLAKERREEAWVVPLRLHGDIPAAPPPKSRPRL